MPLAILPAAGASRRMGRPKLLLPFGDSTVVGSVVRALRDAGVEPIVIVVSPGAEALRTWARTERLVVAENPRPERGMLSSIWCGLDAVRVDDHEGPLLILPADLPLLEAATVRRLIATADEEPDALVLPVHDGERGHPLVVPMGCVRRIRELDPAVGLKQLRERCRVVTVEVDDPGVSIDVDTPEDYRRAADET